MPVNGLGHEDGGGVESRTKRLLKVRNRSAAGCREPVRTPSKSLPDCRPASGFSSWAGRRERASNPSAFQCQFKSQTRNRTRVRMVVQTEGSAAASLSAAGSVSRRIVRAQRCSIKVLICSTTALPAKLCPGSDWSLRAVAGSNFANSRMRRLACALVKPTHSANCSQCRA